MNRQTLIYYSKLKRKQVTENSNLYNIFKFTGIEIPFPIIEDKDMSIAKLYGMISRPMSNTSTVRCVFIIDDKQKIQKCINFTISCKKKNPVYKIYQSLYIPLLGIEYVNNNCKYSINKITTDFNVNINDLLTFENTNLFKNEMYDLSALKQKISECIYKSNINISNNDFETIKLSPKIFLKIYNNLNLDKKHFFNSDLLTILTKELNKNKKDLSNRFEKMLLLNNML